MAEEKDFERVREEELEKFAREALGLEIPEEAPIEITSAEYKRFKREEERRKKTLYELACSLAAKINIEPDEARAKRLQRAIEFAHLDVTPVGAYSLAIVTGTFILFSAILLVMFGLISLIFALIMAMIGVISIYLLAEYPISRANVFRVQASSEIVLAVIYMVIYMRTNPNLERAVKFAALNLPGPLGYDFKKIMWDTEIGKYKTISEALSDYLERWKETEEFVESVQLIKSSLEQPESRRHGMLDEAVNVMLAGTRDRMRSYSEGLRMPVALIHTMGIMLPILVLVMFPIMILMLHETIKPIFLILGYDIVLPLFIFFVSRRMLEMRSFGFPPPDISLHPKYSPLGKVRIGNYYLPSWPFGVLIAVCFALLGIWLLGGVESAVSFEAMLYSLFIIWGIGLGMAAYFLLDTRKKLKIRKEISAIQLEFSEAVFTLGNRLSLGKPMEKAMEDTVERSGDMAIAALFRKALMNIRQGLTLYGSMFDRKFGAVWDYPSKLVINIMRIILEAVKKGVQLASLSALSIARYLKQINRAERDLHEMLSEATSSMKFLAMFLAPLVGGVTVTMAAIMMQIFVKLGATMASLEAAEIPGFNSMLIGGWGGVTEMMPLGLFQVVVGIYVLECCYILSMLASGIENGPADRISERDLAGWTVMIGLAVYSLSLIFTYTIFGSSIEALLVGGI